ncbi:MAG: methionine ABC transporter ATP-binding protein, partial [Pseudomonadota bacterium]
MTEPTLSIRNLVVEIPTRHGILKPVDDVSYDIHPGEILGVVGESGAG